MASLQIYIDQIRGILAGGAAPTDFPWDSRELALAIGQQRDKMLFAKMASMRQDAESSGMATSLAQGFLSTYSGLVSAKDTVRDLWYIPMGSIDWVRGLVGDVGLFRLLPSREIGISFVKLTPAFMSLYQNNHAFGLENEGGYWPEIVNGQRRLYLHRNFRRNSPTEFSVMLIPVIDQSTDPSLDVNIPADMAADIVDAVVRRYQTAGQPDISNNQNSIPV